MLYVGVNKYMYMRLKRKNLYSEGRTSHLQEIFDAWGSHEVGDLFLAWLENIKAYKGGFLQQQ